MMHILIMRILACDVTLGNGNGSEYYSLELPDMPGHANCDSGIFEYEYGCRTL